MAAPAGEYNIVTDQGSTFTRTLTWKDSGDSPVDLTGYTARMQVREDWKSDTPLVLELTTSNGRISLGGVAGTITLSISAADMTEVTAKTFVYDLEMVLGTTVSRLVQGSFTIRPEVTK